MRFDRMPQRRVRANPVMVAAPYPLPHQRPSISKLTKYALNRSLGDADFMGYLAYANVVIGRDSNQHKRVITEKRPSVAVGMWFHNT